MRLMIEMNSQTRYNDYVCFENKKIKMEDKKMSDKLTLSAGERIATLLDDASFVEIGSAVTARATDFNLNSKDTPKDGVVTGYGLIGGRLVYVYSQDAKVLGGSVGEMHAKKIAAVYNLAAKVGAPVIGLVDCAGLRLQEASDSLAAFGALFRESTLASGLVPQITAVFGTCGGGAAVFSALSDFSFASKDAKVFVNSPNALDGNYEGKLDTAAAGYVSENTALLDGVLDSDADVLSEVRNLVGYLPSGPDDSNVISCSDELNRTIPGLESLKDDSRAVLQNIADDNLFFETKKNYGSDVVTGFLRLDGVTVGAAAVQTKESPYLSGAGLKKAARFVKFCDAFNIPVLTLTNVKGFASTVEEEKDIAVNAAALSGALADATVPKVNVVTGDAYGTAYIIWNSKALGADIVYAWPGAKIGAMDSSMEAKILCSDEIAAADDKVKAEAEAKQKIDADQNGASVAARRGLVDDIIEADATRKRVIAAFEMLASKKESRFSKKHNAF